MLILQKAFGVSVTSVAVSFNDPNGVPVPPVNAEQLPTDLAAEFSGEGTVFADSETALKGKSNCGFCVSCRYADLISRRPDSGNRVLQGPVYPSTGS